MNQVILAFGVTAFFTACTTDGVPRSAPFFSEKCGGEVDGYTQTTIRYGDSYMEVKPLSKAVANTEFRVRLKPRRDALGRKVTVSSDPAQSDDGSAWIGESGTVDSERAMTRVVPVGCVPEIAEGTIYKFDVDIEGIGVLDPRVEVVRR